MSEEIKEIERLIQQSGELGDAVIQLARKLRKRNMEQAQIHERPSEDLATLHEKLANLHFYVDFVKREIDPHRHYRQREASAKAFRAVMDGTATPQEVVIQILSAGVADKKMTSAFAVEQLTKLLRPDLSVSRRIQAREMAKAAFEAGDDVVDKVRSFLVGSQRQRSEQQQAEKESRSLRSF